MSIDLTEECNEKCSVKGLIFQFVILIFLCSLFQDGWVGFKAVLLKKRLTAADFYNGYLHQTLQNKMPWQTAEGLFVSRKSEAVGHQRRKNLV